MVRLSVLVPTYHRAEYLRRCIASVLTSKCVDMELVVSNNASPDHTAEVMASFADRRMRCHHQPANVGMMENMLWLIEHNCGQYQLWLSDDDWLVPGAIEHTVTLLDRVPGVGVILSPYHVWFEHKRLVEDQVCFPEARLWAPGPIALTQIWQQTHIWSRTTIRSDLIDLNGWRRHADSLYSNMYVCGVAMKRAATYYTDRFLVNHTWGNPIYWGTDDTCLLPERIRMVKDLTAEPAYEACRQELVGQFLSNYTRTIRRHPWAVYWKRVISALSIPEARTARFVFLAIARSPLPGTGIRRMLRRLLDSVPQQRI